MQKKYVFAVICLIIIISVFCIWRHFSLQISLRSSNFSTNAISYIEKMDIDSNGKAFAILRTKTKQGFIALVHVVKNDLGFWRVERSKVATDQQSYISISWVKGVGARRFSHLDNAIIEKEWHFVGCGNDAMKTIAFLPEQFPENSAINIQQAGSEYIIHQITVSSEATECNIREILEQNGCVKEQNK